MAEPLDQVTVGHPIGSASRTSGRGGGRGGANSGPTGPTKWGPLTSRLERQCPIYERRSHRALSVRSLFFHFQQIFSFEKKISLNFFFLVKSSPQSVGWRRIKMAALSAREYVKVNFIADLRSRCLSDVSLFSNEFRRLFIENTWVVCLRM